MGGAVKKMTSLLKLLSFSLLFCLVKAAENFTVHIIPHTHNDVGWVKTVDQYYYGGTNVRYASILWCPYSS